MSSGRCCIPEALSEELQRKLDRCLPLSGNAPVLIIGDSMLARFQDYGTGRGLLDPAIYENAAVGGTTTNHWIHLLQFTDIFSNIGTYKLVILMLGTNNLSDFNVSADDIVDGLKSIVDTFKRKTGNTRIVFLPIQPRWDLERLNLAQDIDLVNEKMSNICAMIPFKARDQSLFAEDMLHLNRRGYEEFAKTLNAYTNYLK